MIPRGMADASRVTSDRDQHPARPRWGGGEQQGRNADLRRAVIDFAAFIAAMGDGVVASAGLWLGFRVWGVSGWARGLGQVGLGERMVMDSGHLGFIGLGGFLLTIACAIQDLYGVRTLLWPRGASGRLITATLLWGLALPALGLMLGAEMRILRVPLGIAVVLVLGALLAWRRMLALWLSSGSLPVGLRERVLLVGWSPQASELAGKLGGRGSSAYALAGHVPTRTGQEAMGRPRPACELPDLGRFLCGGTVDVLLLADVELGREAIVGIASACERAGVRFMLVPEFFPMSSGRLHLETLHGVPLLGITPVALDRTVNRVVKRGLDLVGGVVGLLASLPMMAVCAVIVRVESAGPILRAEERIGRGGRPFRMLRLRSMRPDAAAGDPLNPAALRHEPPLSRAGRLIRKWNLDELPQFWNVIMGDMSLVGPRPERTHLVSQLSEMMPHYAARHAIKPGITGWAQINGCRGDTDLRERTRRDLWYVDNWSLWLDGQILLLTIVSRLFPLRGCVPPSGGGRAGGRPGQDGKATGL